MHLFRERRRPADPLWDVASATQIFVADPETVARLAVEADGAAHETAVEAVLVATRHPTGWFVHAARRGDLPDAQLPLLRELVTVRTYLLLRHGPQSPAWYPSPERDEWRSVSRSLARDLAELENVSVS